jgi:hypothetical protein
MTDISELCDSAAAVDAFLGMTPEPDEGKSRQWRAFVGGEEVDSAKVLLINSGFDVAIGVGQRPEGYQGPILRQAQGGGEVSLPYFRHPERDGEIWVGLLMESRPNMGGATLCAVGGMNAATLSRDETIRKEGEEEGGFSVEPNILPGAFVNSDRLFFLANPNTGEGVRFGAVEVPFSAVTFEDGITEEAHFAAGTEFGKKPGAVIFKPWKNAVTDTADALALSAIVRLMASL